MPPVIIKRRLTRGIRDIMESILFMSREKYSVKREGLQRLKPWPEIPMKIPKIIIK